MNILIEGWRGINHSYALVNQWQINELVKSSDIFFRDIPFPNKNWNSKKNDSGLKMISQLKYCALSSSLLPFTRIYPYSLSQLVEDSTFLILQN